MKKTNEELKYTIVLIQEYSDNDVLFIDKYFKLKTFKDRYSGQKILISRELLDVEISAFADTSKGSRKLQKYLYKQVLSVYRRLIKVIKFIDRNDIDFDNKFYVCGNNVKNSTIKALQDMLNLNFCVSKNNKLSRQIEYACDYLDNELKINNICDFANGRCRKYKNGITDKCSCCKANCPYGIPCKVKNISCKLFLCDTVRQLGFVFYPQYVPILFDMNFVDYSMCKNSLFLPLERVVKIIKISRIIFYSLIAILLFIVTINIFIFNGVIKV